MNFAERYEQDKKSNKDHVETPVNVVKNIFDLVNADIKRCWFPFDNYDSPFKIEAERRKMNFCATHILDEHGSDYFITLPPKETDLMISNPPFSQQNEVLKRAFYLINSGYIKSFALLLPLAALETPKRSEMFREHESMLSVIVMKKRIKFVGFNETNYNRGCCWLCCNISEFKGRQLLWM